MVQRRLGGGRRSWWGEVVLVDPGCQWSGEVRVVAAGSLQLVGSVDECSGRQVLAGGPLLPGVEGIELSAVGADTILVAVEAAAEVLVAALFAAEAVVFVTGLVALVEEWLGAVGEFVECGSSGVDVLGGFGDRVSGVAAVEESAVGEFVFGSSVALFGVV